MEQRMVFNGTRKLALGATIILFMLLLIPSIAFASDGEYGVKVDTGYLALRTAPAYDSDNEIGELYTGDIVDVIDSSSNKDYWKVYSYKYDEEGWVNKNYLYDINGTIQGDYKVKVDKNYLALRTAPAFERENEIGKLYSGDVVSVLDTSNGQYWYVYSPKYGENGYVNKDYLVPEYYDDDDYSVKVDKNYLALRNAPAFERENEIGKLYTGDVVTVKQKTDGVYWWVYSPKYGKAGYVNKNYLVKM